MRGCAGLAVSSPRRGLGGCSVPAENILGVAGPDLVIGRTALLGGEGAGAGGGAGGHAEAGLGESVEGLLEEVELEVVAGSVALRWAVGVAALVQGLPEDLFGQGRLAADSDAGHPPEFGISLRLPPDGVGAPVADGDVARAPPARGCARRRARSGSWKYSASRWRRLRSGKCSGSTSCRSRK